MNTIVEPQIAIISLIEEMMGHNKFNLSARLWHDLGIHGDDACELLVFLNSKFGVDTSNFQFSDHFPDEGVSLRRVVSSIKSFPKSPYLELSIEDLIESVRKGKLPN